MRGILLVDWDKMINFAASKNNRGINGILFRHIFSFR